MIKDKSYPIGRVNLYPAHLLEGKNSLWIEIIDFRKVHATVDDLAGEN